LPDPTSGDAIAALADRWQRDKSSRLFLQLAEELRRAGRTAEALNALEDGVRWHPDSVAGLVALGRNRLDLGQDQAALEPLERALELDPAQLVASKLLAEAWIRLGDPERARARLDIYRLLNERDAEIDELASRIGSLGRGPETASSRPAPASAVFDLPPLVERPPIELPPPSAVARRPEWAPFAEIHPRLEAERRIVEHLAGEGIFELAAPSPPSPAAAEAPSEASAELPSAAPGPPADETVEPAATLAQPAAAPERAPEMFSLQSIGAEVERETIEEPLAEIGDRAAAPPARRVASSTLAALYLQQGHLDEAEAEFRAVLAARPADDAAIAGLVRLEQVRGVRRPAAVGAGRTGARPGGLTRRKIERLTAMLDRLRQARRSRADVP
jgi:predicted Zn-dependent protease